MRSAIVFLVALLAAVPLQAQEPEWTELSAKRQAGGETSLEVDVEYVAGEIHVGPAAGGLLYDTHLRYDASQFRPRREWSSDGRAGRLDIGFDEIGRDGDLDLELDEENHGVLELGLSPDVPTSLEMTVGAALSRLELGGIPLTRFEYRTGASDTEVAFGSVNPGRMDRLELAVGAAELEVRGLGNARFDRLEFEGGVGDVRLDFSGAWDGDAAATIRMGLGSLTLVVPPDLGVRIDKRGFLASLDAPDFERVDGGWQTPNWESASSHLTIDLQAVLGSIEVRRNG